MFAAALAVGMWATLLRCPSCPQRSLRADRSCPRATASWACGCRAPDAGADYCRRRSIADAGLGLAAVSVALEINVLVLERAPQSLNEDVVHPASTTVHGDFDRGGGQRPSEDGAGELTALVGIEYLWPPKARERLFERRNAERGVHGVRQPPRQHRPARPVHDPPPGRGTRARSGC